jgi:hypothetical protein
MTATYFTEGDHRGGSGTGQARLDGGCAAINRLAGRRHRQLVLDFENTEPSANTITRQFITRGSSFLTSRRVTVTWHGIVSAIPHSCIDPSFVPIERISTDIFIAGVSTNMVYVLTHNPIHDLVVALIHRTSSTDSGIRTPETLQAHKL